jgi:hypothetical protein
MKALRLPACVFPVTYLFRFRNPRDPSLVRARFSSAPGRVEDPIRTRAIVQPAAHLPACSRVDTSGISQVPRQSILCLCPGPRPRPDRRPSPYRCHRCCPRSTHSEGSSDHNFEATHAASAPAAYASRRASPHAMQGSLPAGWLTFTGRESNPLDRDERFQNFMFVLLS